MITNKKTIRETHQRKIVYDTVMSRCDHPTADMIYEAVRKKDTKVSKGTVYRNLNMLSEMGKISHIKVPGGDRFDSTLGKHYHVVCNKCGIVEDVPLLYDFKNDSIIEKKLGYTIFGHNLIFEGICHKCKKNYILGGK